MSRRGFLAGCATCAGAMILPTAGSAAAPRTSGSRPKRIRILYSLHAEVQPGPDWPNVGFDFNPVMRRMTAGLSAGCPDMTFIPTMATGPEQAQAILAQDRTAPVDGYIVMQMNCWNRVIQTMMTSGKPVLYADFPYAGSGGFLVYTAGFIRQGAAHFGFISSSQFGHVVEAARCFATIEKPEEFGAAVARVRIAQTPPPGSQVCKPDVIEFLSPSQWQARMKASKILTVGGEGWRGPQPVVEQLGVQVVEIPYAEVNEAWKVADREKTREVADRWEKRAAKIDGVSRETLETSAAMYLGQKAVLQKHGADAITINCLGGFYGGHIHAYPCLGFHELCNEGLVGACENDLVSTATMVALKNLTGGRTGFISDPVLDMARRQIIYAHCVASNRAFGPEGRDNPIEILTHSEDRQGASVRSLLPVEYMTTTVEFGSHRKELLFHRGKAVENIIEDRACRTKLAVEPDGDFEKLFTQWDRFGWHRVTVYGDLKEPLFEIARMLKWTVTEEA
jgi:L-fucose isomerase-like protein